MADGFLIFEQTIEALYLRALGGRLTPQCKARLRQAGLDVDQKLKPAYSFQSWMTFLHITVEEQYPDLSLEEGAFKLGEAYIEGFRETMLGRAVLSLLRVLGPRRALARTTQNFRAANNYTESRLTELGPYQVELWMNEVGSLPSFTAGILHAGLRVAGAEKIHIEPTQHDGHACVFRISWGEDSVSTALTGDGSARPSKRSGPLSSA